MEEIKLSNDQITACVNAWVYFTLNYPVKWIDECFEGWEIQHFQAKFDHFAEKYGERTAMNILWCELDEEHRHKLIEYTMKKFAMMQRISY